MPIRQKAMTRFFIYLQNMKAVQLTINILFTLFLIICIAVHVVGLCVAGHLFTITSRVSDEPVYSHIIHMVSYCVCLFVLLRPIKYRTLIYCLAAIYPFCYHAHCAWVSYTVHDKFNAICILVIIEMPLIALWIWKQASVKESIAQ
jgi:hypothetical protein